MPKSISESKDLVKFAPVLIVIAAILWGIDGVVRVSLYSLPALIIVFYEHVIGTVLLAPFFWRERNSLKLSQHQWFAIIWVSLVSGLLGTLWFTQALMQTDFIPFSVVFLLQKLQPVFAMITAVFLLKEKITTKYLIWVIPALIAGFFLTFPSGSVNLEHPGTVTAALYAVGAAIAWGSSTAVSRFALKGQSETVMTFLRFSLTSVFGIIGVVLLGMQTQLLSPSMPQLYRLIFIALSTGMVALWLYYKGLKHTQAKISTILELALPLTAVVIDLVWFKNTLLPVQYLAAVVMFVSVYQVGRMHKGTKVK